MTWLAVSLALCCVLLLYMYSRQKQSYEHAADRMTEYLMKVQDRDSFPEISEEAEGSMKILQSEIYKVSASLHEQYALEQQKNRYLEDMLSNIAHQIRTPLTAITIMTDTLKNADLSEAERRRCLYRISQEGDHLSWLTETLLAIARLDAGTLILKKEEVRIKEIIGEITDSLAVTADLQDTVITDRTDVSSVLTCDRQWTKEALTNIIKNCLEHTENGSVDITADDTNISLDIMIRDTGSGIAAEDLPRLFDRFYTGRNALSTSVGIGLALSAQIIRMQNGTVSVTSTPGEGTCFAIRFYRSETL